jgi:hypothetical protein
MQQQAEVIALSDVLHDFARAQPEEMVRMSEATPA